MGMDYQHIYLYMDDSGKISKSEDYAVFAGIVFQNTSEKSKFTNMYRQINEEIKCKYCTEDNQTCSLVCPEIKAFSIKPKHRRRIINLSKEYTTFATVIYNKNLHGYIVNNKASKGRFNEYAQRRIIKTTINNLISRRIINPNLPVYLHVNIDEMPTKTNGYYTLHDGLIEKLRYGIINYNYGTIHKPILHNDLKLNVVYKDSKNDFGIQMADILANTVRHSFVINNNWFETSEYLRAKCHLDILLRLPK
jgi:hypothetical protein